MPKRSTEEAQIEPNTPQPVRSPLLEGLGVDGLKRGQFVLAFQEVGLVTGGGGGGEGGLETLGQQGVQRRVQLATRGVQRRCTAGLVETVPEKRNTLHSAY